MALKLLSCKRNRIIHIALFLCVALFSAKLNAQSVLLPGDVVVVSANADTQSVDLIPLIDIEEGTTLYISGGSWNDSTQTLSGKELEVTFLENVEAGTNIFINPEESELVRTSGTIDLTQKAHRLFLYQKAGAYYRHIFALGWGNERVWRQFPDDKASSDIPSSLKQDQLFLRLGAEENHQYYIRNGASGTRNLLLKFVTDEANWRSNDEPFARFGTSFNLLDPPVILFERSLSTVQEGDSIATLNVAIYEHDGSRLTADVTFNSSQSIINADDIKSFNSETLNFTGLIGDAVYEVHVPIADDEKYEGRETGIFNLENLSKGNFGDFLSHSLVIQDNEQPNISIASVDNDREGYGQIELISGEDGPVSLNGWKLRSEQLEYLFPDQAVLIPGESLKVRDIRSAQPVDSARESLIIQTDKPLLNEKGGLLQLIDYRDELIDEFTYGKNDLTENKDVRPKDEPLRVDAVRSSEAVTEVEQGTVAQVTLAKSDIPGWKVLPAEPSIVEQFPEVEWVAWSEERSSMEKYEDIPDALDGSEVLFGYFEPREAEVLNEFLSENKRTQKEGGIRTMALDLSATDYNENNTIDRLEGLNIAVNNLSESILVERFLEVFEMEYPELDLNPVVYGFERNSAGEMNIVPLAASDSLMPKAPFWLMLQSKQEPVRVVFQKENLLQPINANRELDEPKEIPRFGFEFSVPNTDQKESLLVGLGSISHDQKDLESYPEMQFAGQSFLKASIHTGKDYFSTFGISEELSTIRSLPVFFDMDKNGSVRFAVTEWGQLPEEWIIKLEDRLLDKTYTLRDGFVLNFDYNRSGSKETDPSGERAVDDAGAEDTRFVLHIIPPGAEKGDKEVVDAPRELELYQNYPNPFNPVTTISFYLPQPEEVKLSVFNIVGQPIAVIIEGTLSAGEKHFEWDASDRPSGMYIYQLEVGNKVMTRKMTLVK